MTDYELIVALNNALDLVADEREHYKVENVRLTRQVEALTKQLDFAQADQKRHVDNAVLFLNRAEDAESALVIERAHSDEQDIRIAKLEFERGNYRIGLANVEAKNARLTQQLEKAVRCSR